MVVGNFHRCRLLRSPLLWPSVLTPTSEVSEIKTLQIHVSSLPYSVAAWEAALLLYETSKKPSPTIDYNVADRWRWLACNACILELYHLRVRLEKIQSVRLRRCPSLHSLVDSSRLRSARKRLDEYFPHIEALRHATAHMGENEAYPEVHAPDGLFSPAGFRQPERYSLAYKGTMRYLDITRQSLQLIEDVVAEYLSAFQDASTTLAEQGHLA